MLCYVKLLVGLSNDFTEHWTVHYWNRTTPVPIKLQKSPGPDGITNWLLQDFAPPLLSATLTTIFNASLRGGYFPSIWKSAELVPVHKTHPPTSMDNEFRPIALLPTTAKVFESVVLVGRLMLSVFDTVISSLSVVKLGQPPTRLKSCSTTRMSSIVSDGSLRTVFMDVCVAFDPLKQNIHF